MTTILTGRHEIMKYMKEAGPGHNLYKFWLCYCEVYVVVSLLHYIVTWTGRAFVHDDIAIPSWGIAVGLFFFRRWPSSRLDLRTPPKVKFSK
jgi:hypothetical protein